MILILYLYDSAICDDLKLSFNPENVPDPTVKVISTDSVISLKAQLQSDNIKFPLVSLIRDDNLGIDNARTNFTRMHNGVASVLDPKTNELYYEKVVPVKIGYQMHILTTNRADMDELIREIIFKYISMYFLTIKLPYECNRKIRFGIVIPPDTNIETTSSTNEYIQSGQLYESVIPLNCEGAVLVYNTPAKLKRTKYEIDPTNNI